MSQPRSTPAVWVSLLLIIAAITTFALGAKHLQGSPTRHGLGGEVYVALVIGLLGSVYFIARLAYAGVTIVFGFPPTRRVAWLSPAGAHIHGGFILAVVIAAMVMSGENLAAIVVGHILAQAALVVIGRYANLRETQGWDINESAPVVVASRPRPVSAPPRSVSAAPRPAAPIVVAVAPPVSYEAPRGAQSSSGDEPSLLR